MQQPNLSSAFESPCVVVSDIFSVAIERLYEAMTEVLLAMWPASENAASPVKVKIEFQGRY